MLRSRSQVPKAGMIGMMCAVMIGQAQAPKLQSHRIGNTQYVTVKEMAVLYNLGHDISTATERAVYKSKNADLILLADAREIDLNGVHHWLSFPILSTRGTMWISALDVLKTIDPVLRQGRASKPATIRTVVIDAGHGGADRGTHGATNRNEKEFNLDVAKRIERQLTGSGLRVLQTRTTDDTLSLDDRVEFCKAKRGDLFVSVHFNSGGSADGIETYCMPPTGAVSTADSKGRRIDVERSPGNATDEQNIWLAHTVQQSLLHVTSAGDRGVRRARFYVLRNATCPAILVEAGFLTNRAEEKKILTSEYRDQLAKAIAEGILNYKKSVESQ